MNEHLVTSNYLVDNIHLWLWDFDDTLIDTTTYYIKSMEPKDILKRTDAELDKEFPSWRFYKVLIPDLVKRGRGVGIVSFGTGRIIKAYMDRIFGLDQKLFHTKNLKAVCRDERGIPIDLYPNKNKFIKEIMDFYRINNFNKVVLFDDLMSNIAAATTLGIISYKIPGVKGSKYHRIDNFGHNSQELFTHDSLIKLELQLKKLCKGKDIFSAIGSRKNGMKNNTRGHIIEGFSCSSCGMAQYKFLVILVYIITIVVAIFMLYEK